jgi:hypothetical protein
MSLPQNLLKFYERRTHKQPNYTVEPTHVTNTPPTDSVSDKLTNNSSDKKKNLALNNRGTNKVNKFGIRMARHMPAAHD